MTGAWRFDPFARIQRYVGVMPELTDEELAAHGYTKEPKPIKHGTPNGYNQHRRRGQVACEDCRVANSAASQERKARKTRRAVA